ncbi:MAG: helix-turn-helix transcriptional regulator [Chloroflexia bacterium]|nr:helix-turn-helix transcriptional regulator [Chloroflexia bacterium]
MRPRTYDCGYGCPIEAGFDVIGGRWKGVLLYHLLDGPKRNSELRRRVPGVTPRVLALQLRELEAAGVLSRTVYPEVPPKVEYQLTTFGRDLEPILLQVRDWGETYLDRIEAALAS